jgi:hypothetical protein
MNKTSAAHMYLQVLNLFLALLLSNFGSSSLSAPTADNETNKIAEAFDRFSRFFNWIKRSALNVAKMLRAKLTNQISDQTPGEGPSSSWKEGLYPIRSLVPCACVRGCAAHCWFTLELNVVFTHSHRSMVLVLCLLVL